MLLGCWPLGWPCSAASSLFQPVQASVMGHPKVLYDTSVRLLSWDPQSVAASRRATGWASATSQETHGEDGNLPKGPRAGP